MFQHSCCDIVSTFVISLNYIIIFSPLLAVCYVIFDLNTKMSLACVVSTFVMCIFFNIILPSGDVQSDLYLMYQTLTFNLGDSLELEGCKSCFYKTDQEVYNPEKDLTDNECKTCLFDNNSDCGSYPIFLKKMREFENENQTCLDNETFNIGFEGELIAGECDELNNDCCVTKTTESKTENPVQMLDPKKLFHPCRQLTGKLDYCIVSGKSYGTDCINLSFEITFKELLNRRQSFVEASPTNETTFFYPYSDINQSLEMKENNHPITDPDVGCGLLFFRHKTFTRFTLPPGVLQEQRVNKYTHHCEEDVCRTHLRALHRQTSITNFIDWKNRTDYFFGIKVGGKTCRLLQIYGMSILIPILLNLSFNILLFANDFRDKKANIIEIIPLMFLFYPQYKTIKFLAQYLFHRDENILNKETEEHDRSVAPLEPFLESCLQVNISLAILFATEGFFQKNERGETIVVYENFNSALPLLTFISSLFCSSFGMTKFFLSGPIPFLPNDSACNGLLSIPFLSLFLINSMFGFRIVCIESAFFTSYRYQDYVTLTNLNDINDTPWISITPIIPPEYRLLIYLAPSTIPLFINGLKVWCTTKGSWKYFMKYPQFIISPCFTPFLYEGYETNDQQGRYKLKIWRFGTIINAIYIGCIPQCILCIIDYYKGVHDWKFDAMDKDNGVFEFNDALFKTNYGNTVFAITTATFFLVLIILFFGSGRLFSDRGTHCRCLNILCRSCSKSCISLTEPEHDP